MFKLKICKYLVLYYFVIKIKSILSNNTTPGNYLFFCGA